MKKVPKLRFKEFTGEWEEKKIEDCFDFLQNNTFSRNDLNYQRGNVKNIHYGDILTKYNILLDVQNKKVPFINEDKILVKFKEESFLRSGDIVISDTAEDQTVGKVIEILNDKKIKILAGLHTYPIRPKNKFAKRFLGEYMNCDFFHNQIIPFITGIKVSSISKSSFKLLNILYPNLQEQEKIANFLSSVDKKISLTEEKLELFKNYKKGIMQKIFSQKLRFKDENGNDYPEWEEKKLGEIINYFSGSAFPELYQGSLNEKYPFYKVGDMNGINNKKYMFDANNYISEEVRNILKCKVAPKNTIIFPKVGATLLTNKRRILTTNSIFDNNILGIKGKKSDVLNDNFLYFFMQIVDFAYFVQEGALPSISKNIIDKIKINLPCLEEQEKIANFLSFIDEKIEKIENELENLKEFKKGLLQQMFI